MRYVCFCQLLNSSRIQGSAIKDRLENHRTGQKNLLATNVTELYKSPELVLTCDSASLTSFGNPLTDPESIDRKTWQGG